ncbi:MAG: GNAT family N-acetyltransferase [Pedobacter sp.]|jgi:ribosomal protein S18 acetylase RimI-like enzyme|uniref:GNAT family N-acetyltransferase n=1 Tax=Pedobacter sp. TaxID=1411316 RepID=UPI003564B415
MKIATSNDKQLVVEILTKSFINNKSVNYIIPQNELKTYSIYKLMAYSFEVCSICGKVVLSDDGKACALILYPEQKKRTLKFFWLDLKLLLTSVGIQNARKALTRKKKINAAQPKLRMAYLWFIGVDPKYQKFGLGKKLMEEIIINTMQDNRPIYLETSTIENLPWYKKFGFEVYDELILDYTLYFLKRSL